jgi:hypothetical protein
MYVYSGKPTINKWYSSPAVWLAGAAGAVCPILVNNLPTGLSIWGGVYLPAGLLLLLGWLLEYYMPGRTTFAGIAALAGIAVGVVADVNLDWLLRGRDRNLWPLEIVIWWVLAPAPMFVGAVLRKVFTKRKSKEG